MKIITVTFSGGKATIDTRGFQGASCVTETLELEAALGVTTSDQKTPEFFQKAPVAQTQKAGR